MWYEIARMPVIFEKDLVLVTANYSLKKDGGVKVVNEGFKFSKDGKYAGVTGKAKFAGTPDVGHLRVSFFGPFYSDYIIVELDPEYQWALVAGISHDYLWILARTPALDPAILDRLVKRAAELGFDTGRLIYVKQE